MIHNFEVNYDGENKYYICTQDDPAIYLLNDGTATKFISGIQEKYWYTSKENAEAAIKNYLSHNTFVLEIRPEPSKTPLYYSVINGEEVFQFSVHKAVYSPYSEMVELRDRLGIGQLVKVKVRECVLLEVVK